MTRDPSARELRTLGTEMNPHVIAATAALVAPLHASTSREGVRITRDQRYGTDERHRLDVFEPTSRGASLPVLLFVHGGGFTAGDKTFPNSPFHDNVGLWAVRNGLVGVTMTYRLAPQHTWPSGSADVSSAVLWIRHNIASCGGDPSQVFMMGQSAGAVHVAGYIARELDDTGGRAPHASWKPARALLISGLYDTDTMQRDEHFRSYFGNDDAKLENVSFLGALASTGVPLFVAVAEWDPQPFQDQFVQLLEALVRRRLPLPRFVQLAGHNHLSPVWCMGTPADALGPELKALLFQSIQTSSA